MTQKDRENRFIVHCKKMFETLTWESEQLLRYGYSMGANELAHVGYAEGVEMQRNQVLDALGASARKVQALP